MGKTGQSIFVGTKLHSSEILEGDKKETKQAEIYVSGSTETRLIRAVEKKKKDVLCESGFVLFSAPLLETRAFCIFFETVEDTECREHNDFLCFTGRLTFSPIS